jgi:hypothetical protein
MTGTSTAAARKQIQLGVAILRGCFAWLKPYGFPWPTRDFSRDHVQIALMVYSWGQGNMKPYLDQLRSTGRPITAAEIASRWPNLGKPANQPLRYSRRVWKKAHGGGLVSPGPGKKTKPDSMGWGILAIVAMVAFATKKER